MPLTQSTLSRKKRTDIRSGVLRRHVLVLLLAAVLVPLFAEVQGQWSAMHRWNRAFGDASLVLVALSFGLGPLSRLYRRAGRFLAFRREMGIYGCILAFVHAFIVLAGWVEYDLNRLFGFEFHPQLQIYVMVENGFGLGNALGIGALVLVLLLATTSNDFAVRKLGSSGWKFIQMGVLPLWWLSIAHVAYFLYAHFLSFHRNIPDPNPLQLPFAILVALILALRIAAYVRTVRGRSQRSGQSAASGPTAA